MPVGDGVPDAPQGSSPALQINRERGAAVNLRAGHARPSSFHSIHRITFVASTKSCDSYRCCAPSFWASTCSSRYSSRRLRAQALGRSQQLAANALPAHTCVHDQIPQTGIPVGQHTAERRRPARIVDQRKAHGGAVLLRQQKISVIGPDCLADLVHLTRGLAKNSGCSATMALSSWRYSAIMAGMSSSAIAGRITVFAIPVSPLWQNVRTENRRTQLSAGFDHLVS